MADEELLVPIHDATCRLGLRHEPPDQLRQLVIQQFHKGQHGHDLRYQSTQAVANDVITANPSFLQNAYRDDTYNLWEEEKGASIFARSVQLKCLEEIRANTLGIPPEVRLSIWRPAAGARMHGRGGRPGSAAPIVAISAATGALARWPG